MFQDNKIWIGKSGEENVYIYPKMANRHGLIAGATGTGKTVTLKCMAESFSAAGVPVFLADIKGDLAGMCQTGINEGSVAKRIEEYDLFNQGFSLQSFPVTFWDVYGEKGIRLRTTISDMGPLLLSQILDLNDTQSELLNVLFKIADDEQLLLLDTKDLKSFINYVVENADSYGSAYGNMPKQSLNTIIRAVVALEAEGGEEFFTEPALNIKELSTCEYDGKGRINILECQKLINNPRMYSAFMLWLLSELYENMPEEGDLDKPKMVFFFDEAHFLFEVASKQLISKIEQIVKLIRSKGIGIYFITQNPQDIPDGVLGQLSNKIQHALRAYTPKELKGAKIAAESFRENPEFDTFQALTELAVGEALISVLDEKGIPTIVERTFILPPQSFLGTIGDDVRTRIIENNPLNGKYSETIDRISAYELLEQKAIASIKAAQEADCEVYSSRRDDLIKEPNSSRRDSLVKEPNSSRRSSLVKEPNPSHKESLVKEPNSSRHGSYHSDSSGRKKEDANSKALKRAAKNVSSTAASTIGREVGNNIGEGIGGKFGKKLAGNVGSSIGRNLIGVMFK